MTAHPPAQLSQSLSRRSLLRAAAAATLGLGPAVSLTASLAACRPDAATDLDGSVADPDVITWYASSVTQSQNDPRRILADVFERDHLGLTVHEISGNARTDAMRENLRRNISTGDIEPDVFLGDVIWPAEFASDGLAVPLDEVLGNAFWQRFEKGYVEASSYQGKVYAAPFFADRGMLFYRTDLVLRPPDTWQELADMVKTVREKTDIGGFVWQGDDYEGLTCCWTEFAAGAGAPLPTPERPDAPLDTPEAVEALRFLVRLISEGVSPPDVVNFQEPQAMQMFNAGQAVFMRGWNTAWASMTDPAISQVASHVGVAPLPTFDGGGAERGERFSTVGGWSLFMNPNSKKRNASGRFIDWMTDVGAQKIMARFGVIPTNLDVLRDAELTALYEPLRVAGACTPVFRPSAFPNYTELTRAVHTNVHRALIDDNVRPEAALREADRRFHEARRARSGG
jgi:multiple sugar transport system substrate-binding protein